MTKVKTRIGSCIAVCILHLLFIGCGGVPEAQPTLGSTEMDAPTAALIYSNVQSLTTLNSTTYARLNSSLLGAENISSPFLSRSEPLAETIDVSPVRILCPTSGNAGLSGALRYVADNSALTVDSTFAETLTACAVTQTVAASDGDCEITTIYDGAFDVAYTFDYEISSTDYTIASIWTTTANHPLDFTISDAPHTVDLAVAYSSDRTGAEALTGTITVDGTAYDVAQEIDTTNYSRAELGCE